MKLLSLHPKNLDSNGLVTPMIEALLAKAVPNGKTKGYKNHPQLTRFKINKNPKTHKHLPSIFTTSQFNGVINLTGIK